jgi:hypothetical protein
MTGRRSKADLGDKTNRGIQSLLWQQESAKPPSIVNADLAAEVARRGLLPSAAVEDAAHEG